MMYTEIHALAITALTPSEVPPQEPAEIQPS